MEKQIAKRTRVVGPKVFLCYAREDAEKVQNLYKRLSDVGLSPWMDKENIVAGEIWELSIQRAIRSSDFFLTCLSKNSVNKRGVIQKEIKSALDIWQEMLESDIYLIPVRMDDCEVPETLRKFQWVNLFEENGWNKLMEAIQIGMERLGIINITWLRSKPIDNLSWADVTKMLQEKDFYHIGRNEKGKGMCHFYEMIEKNEKALVIDYATGLIWQQSGSKRRLNYNEANAYISQLNEEKFGGYNDWRLPTLEEAMSLMEVEEKNGKLHINQLFDQKIEDFWTADKISIDSFWAVHFDIGSCNNFPVPGYYKFVRAVRSGTSIDQIQL